MKLKIYKSLVKKFISSILPENDVVFFVNGEKYISNKVSVDENLSTFLRNNITTSVKTSCEISVCGFCTVVMQELENDKVVSKQINSCNFPLFLAHGKHFVTAEGLKENKEILTRIQDLFANDSVFQCGFCAPGIILFLYGEILRNPETTSEELVNSLSNCSCRCTGYRPIIETTRKVINELGKENERNCFGEYESEIIFPKELRSSFYNKNINIYNVDDVLVYSRPNKIDEVLSYVQNGGKIMSGCVLSSLNDYKKLKCIVNVENVEELKGIRIGDDNITIGSGVKLCELEEFCNDNIEKNEVFRKLGMMLRNISKRQIKNISTVGGNIFNTTIYNSDLLLFIIGIGGKLTVSSATKGRRELNGDDVLSFPPVIEEDEILVDISIPLLRENEYFKYYSKKRKKKFGVTISNAVIKVNYDPSSKKIEKCKFSVGGYLKNKIMQLKNCEKFLENLNFEKSINTSTISDLCDHVIEKMDIPNDVTNFDVESVEYKKRIIKGFAYKFIKNFEKDIFGIFDEREISIIKEFDDFNRNFSSKIDYEEVVVGTSQGKCEKNIYSKEICNGDAIFVNDIPRYKDELHCVVCYSKTARGRIKNIDVSKIMEMEGIHAWIDHTDIPGSNNFSVTGIEDEELLSSGELYAYGQPIGLIVAENVDIAKRARDMIVIDVEELPSIITIDEAIENDSFFDFFPQLQNGDPYNQFEISDHCIEGEINIGSQRHFYGEPQTSLVIPMENDEFIVHSANQDLAGVQRNISSSLNIPCNKIIAKTKRVGGAFGGKHCRASFFTTLNAIAASTLNRPTRLVLDREDDTIMSSPRHPFKGVYKVGFSSDGIIEAVHIDLYSNSGYFHDLSLAVMEHGFCNMESCYNIPNIRFNGYCCKTNIISPSAFRGFGLPQAQIVMERVVERVSTHLNIDSLDVKKKNLYKKNNMTPYGQKLPDCNIEEIVNELEKTSEYYERKKEIDKFNKNNKFMKRAIVITPTKQTYSYAEAQFLNNGSALVNIYTDGTVCVSIGGIEMGQGITTKVCQVVASILECKIENVYVNCTGTDKTPNASPSAASIGSDVYCGAVSDAANQLNNRLKPFKDLLNFPNESNFVEVVSNAFFSTTNLSAQGFCKLVELNPIHFPSSRNVKTPPGKENRNTITPYFIYGAACAEVELDCIIGDFDVRRIDILMDLGNSISPIIDIGQVEGGFIQGFGFCTIENEIIGGNNIFNNNAEELYDWIERGKFYTTNLDKYSIPLTIDMPSVFNINLLKGSKRKQIAGFGRSKVSGEPPLYLGTCVFHAIRRAMNEYDKEVERKINIDIDFPATAERINRSLN